MSLRTKPAPRLCDLVDDDQRCVALEGFRPVMGQMVNKGEYYKLSDGVVRAFPQSFCVLVPVDQVLGEIERRR